MRIQAMNLNKTGQNICILRKRSGVSVRELQELLGFATPQAIYKWQHGISLPTVDNLVALASILDVSVEEIQAVDYPKGED
ncbi:MAG: helix-turn-helix transcriptional regulator [Clostridia bacterium]|nr:helix-turn-helix transcriptional regulator [Clostridia bacterium]